MDVSGNQEKSNYNYLGVVLGTNESIQNLSKELGSYPEHMSKIPKNERSEIIKKLTFDGNDRIAFCFKLDRKRILSEVKNSRKGRRISTGKILNVFETLIMKELRKRIENFVLNHKTSLTELRFQCDDDCVKFLRNGSFQKVPIGIAYRISDYVAWCNNNDGIELKQVIEVNITEDLSSRIMKNIS